MHLLPVEHPDRNRPLVGARYWPKGKTPKAGKTVLPTYKIANNTFNELGPAWTEHDHWSF